MLDESLLRDFLGDSREHLAAIEPDLLALDREGDQTDPETVHRVFRAIHSIKGFSVFLGFAKFSQLSHAMENLLTLLRDGQLHAEPQLVDALLAGVDKLRLMLEDIQASEQMDTVREMALLSALLEQAPAQASPRAQTPPPAPAQARPARRCGQGGQGLTLPLPPDWEPLTFALDPQALAQALEAELWFYAVRVHVQDDLAGPGLDPQAFLDNLGACGQCLAQDLLEQDAQAGPWRHCLLATIIEDAETTALALDLPVERVAPFSAQDLRQARATAAKPETPPPKARLAPQARSAPQAGSAPQTESAPRARLAPQAGSAPEGGEAHTLPLGCPRHPEPFVFSAPLERLRQAQQEGLRLWALWLEPPLTPQVGEAAVQGFLADLDSLGLLLFSDLEQNLPQGEVGHCLLASVIQRAADLAQVLDLDPDQLVSLEPEAWQVPASPPLPGPAVTPPLAQAGVPASPAPAPRLAHVPPAAGGAAPAEKASSSAETIRVNVGLVDRLINLAGELVLGRNQLRRHLEEQGRRNQALGAMLQGLGQVTSQMQENIMQLRTQPVGSLLGKFPRLVRELSRQLSKEVDLTITGGEADLDKSILEQLSDPLTHLIRNCLDHGIEPPEERQALGKPRAGQVVVMAFHEEGMMNLAIHDDGRGIDAEAVAAKAVAAGQISPDEARRLSPAEKLSLICLPGLSTARQVSDLSGRGVGMDVVATNIERLGGHVQIESDLGVGTTIRLRLPLTLAIIPSLVVGCAGRVFAIPQTDVQELLLIRGQQAASRIELVGQSPVVRLRNRLLPLVRLSQVLELGGSFREPASGQERQERRRRIADRRARQLGREGAAPAAEVPERRGARPDRRRRAWQDIYVVVIRMGSHRYGLIVDQLFDTEEIVVKPLPRHLQECRCFGGATIMGDGRVAMILDAGGIASHAQLRFGEISAHEDRQAQERARRENLISRPKTSLVIFRYGGQEQFAVPLNSVARLEQVGLNQVQVVGGRECVPHAGGALSLLRLDRLLPVGSFPDQADKMYLLIPRGAQERAGLVASEVVDILDAEIEVGRYAGPQRGVAGLCELQGRITMLLNLEELLADFGDGDSPPSASWPGRPGAEGL